MKRQIHKKLKSAANTFLAAFLLHEKYKLGDESKFKPFIDLLPGNVKDIPLQYDPNLTVYLIGSPTLSKIKEINHKFEHDYDILCQYLPQFCQDYTLAQFKWAMTMVETRKF